MLSCIFFLLLAAFAHGQCPTPAAPTVVSSQITKLTPVTPVNFGNEKRITCPGRITLRINADQSGGIIDRQDYYCDTQTNKWKGVVDRFTLRGDELMACVELAPNVDLDACTIDLIDEFGKISIFYLLDGYYTCGSNYLTIAKAFDGRKYSGPYVNCVNRSKWTIGSTVLEARPTVTCEARVQCRLPIVPLYHPFKMASPVIVAPDNTISCPNRQLYLVNPDLSGGIIDRNSYYCDPMTNKWKGTFDGFRLRGDELMLCIHDTLNLDACTIDLTDGYGKTSIFFVANNAYTCGAGYTTIAKSASVVYSGTTVSCINSSTWKIDGTVLYARPTVTCQKN